MKRDTETSSSCPAILARSQNGNLRNDKCSSVQRPKHLLAHRSSLHKRRLTTMAVAEAGRASQSHNSRCDGSSKERRPFEFRSCRNPATQDLPPCAFVSGPSDGIQNLSDIREDDKVVVRGNRIQADRKSSLIRRRLNVNFNLSV